MSGPGTVRATLERASTRPLVFLRLLPRWTVPLAVAAVCVAGLVAPGWAGAVALGVVAVFIGWLAALSWPGVNSAGRLLRVAAVAAVAVLAVSRIVA